LPLIAGRQAVSSLSEKSRGTGESRNSETQKLWNPETRDSGTQKHGAWNHDAAQKTPRKRKREEKHRGRGGFRRGVKHTGPKP